MRNAHVFSNSLKLTSPSFTWPLFFYFVVLGGWVSSYNSWWPWTHSHYWYNFFSELRSELRPLCIWGKNSTTESCPWPSLPSLPPLQGSSGLHTDFPGLFLRGYFVLLCPKGLCTAVACGENFDSIPLTTFPGASVCFSYILCAGSFTVCSENH